MVQLQACTDDFMRFAVNGQMQIPPDTTALYAVLFDFPFAFTEALQAGGINHQMCNSPQVGDRH